MGQKKKKLEKLSNAILPNQVSWFGTIPMSKVSNFIYQSDCLVLPSRHDGWGAVVSESLMLGTPVICSEACGSSIIVKASNSGGVFKKNNISDLKVLLNQQFKKGIISHKSRQNLIKWAKNLSAKSGAKYLENIIDKKNNLIEPPWLRKINKID